ncbi:MAG: protein-L-isoaspartate(D-aspartate) O-methyltransferase [Candidatus Zixiibacteriota bacterium]
MHEQPTDPFFYQRQMMVEKQIAGRDIVSAAVIDAMRTIPRHEFVPDQYRSEGYTDSPLPIGLEQTISQPYIVALMTQLAAIDASSTVLEVGTGSGYQTAVLASIAARVFSVEILEPLYLRAKATLEALGFQNIELRHSDGHSGWPEVAPFDAILVTAAPEQVPQALIDQLKMGGRLIVPVGAQNQELFQITKSAQGEISKAIVPVKFVPMTGESMGT